MTELLTRLRFAVAALQGRPIARHLTITNGTLTHKMNQLTEDCIVIGIDLATGADRQVFTVPAGEWRFERSPFGGLRVGD